MNKKEQLEILKNSKPKKRHVILFIAGLSLLCYSLIFIFTRTITNLTPDLSSTGQIGDTIGGIAGPIINIIGAGLIFLSFREQFNANKIQIVNLEIQLESSEQQVNFSQILELFKELKAEYENLDHGNSNGRAALNVYLNDFEKNYALTPDKFKNARIVKDYLYFIFFFTQILQKISESNLKENDKKLLNYNLKMFYRFKVKSQNLKWVKLCTENKIMDKFKNSIYSLQTAFDNLESND